MNKETIAAADFQRKTYAKPRIKVVEIEGADIICTSGKNDDPFGLKGQGYEEEDW